MIYVLPRSCAKDYITASKNHVAAPKEGRILATENSGNMDEKCFFFRRHELSPLRFCPENIRHAYARCSKGLGVQR